MPSKHSPAVLLGASADAATPSIKDLQASAVCQNDLHKQKLAAASVSDGSTLANAPESEMSLSGSCFCGACELQVSGPLKFSMICHCSICQRLSGAPYGHWIGCANEQVVVTKGELVGFKSSSHMTRYSCKTCSAPIYNQCHLEGNEFRDVPTSFFTGSGMAIPPPEAHCFYSSCVRPVYNAVMDGLPKFSDMPGQSDMVQESGLETMAKAPESEVDLSGSCLCGACELQVSGPLKFSMICHCSICQRLQGAPYGHWIGCANEQVVVTKGELVGFKSSSHMTRYSCKACSAPIYNQCHLEGNEFRDVPTNFFTGSRMAIPPPEAHCFYSSRVRPVRDGLPKFSDMPGGSMVEE